MKHFLPFLLAFCILTTFAQEEDSLIMKQFIAEAQSDDERVLVISGGGSRGAFAAGLIYKLNNDLNFDYQGVFGTSTGALIAPLALLEKHATLREVYSTTRQKDILDKNIVTKKGKIRSLPILCAVLFGRKSVAGSKNLKKLIEKNYTPDDHQEIQAGDKEFVVTTVSLETTQLTYRSSHDYDYNAMVDWIWASANQPVFMTAVEKPGEIETITYSENDSCKIIDRETETILQHWVDGGIKENIPLKKAVEYANEKAIDIIDVIVLGNARIDDYLNRKSVKRKKFNVTDQLFRTIDVFSFEAAKNDILSGLYQSKTRNKTVYIYYINPKFLNVSSLDFQPEIMNEMWLSGYQYDCTVGTATINDDGDVIFNPEEEVDFEQFMKQYAE